MRNKEASELWSKISTLIADEIQTNEEFAKKISGLFVGDSLVANKPTKSKRRSPAKLDPFSLYEKGIDTLKSSLQELSIEELKDVIAANGMDTARLAMKWKDHNRLMNHIIEMTQTRSSHGEAFWNASKDKSLFTD